MKRVKVLIFTDDFEKWVEKIESSIKIERKYKTSYNEVVLGNDLIIFRIKKSISENCRGLDPGIIIMDKAVDYEQESAIVRPLFGHGGSYIRGEGYKLLNEPDWGVEELEIEMKKWGE